MTTSHSSYLIVGAGVFGASTALHLAKKYPSAKITLVDRTIPCQAGASWDWSKVVRADYTNISYMKLALEAMDVWRTDPMYKQFYHESGLIWVDDKGFARTVIENYNHLKANEKVRMTNPEEIGKLYDGMFDNAEYNGLTEILINESSGWVDASKALEKVIETAAAAGVECVEGEVACLEFAHGGSCLGVQCISGKRLSADSIVLATGAGTAKLLADSAPDRAELQAGNRLVAAAIFTGMAKLGTKQAEKFKTGPVFLHAVGQSQGASFPPNAERELKFARDLSFKNTVEHLGQLISMPPAEPDYAQWKLSQGMKNELNLVCAGIFGKEAQDFHLENYRICWDAITPNQDFLISAHSHCENLFMATGGSFHAWKFLPILGKYVVELLEGRLDPKLAKKWAWNRDDNGSAHKGLVPHREMRDIS